MIEFRFEHEGRGLLGTGVRERIHLPSGYGAPDAWTIVRRALAAAGEGAVALGALPFDPAEPCSFVIPAEVTRGELPAPPMPDPAHHESPDGFSLTSTRPHREFLALVESAVAAIESGVFDKVVLAREVMVEANRPIVVHEVLERLRTLYPSTMVFSIDGYVGASPELLVSRDGAEIVSHPLAGTYARSGDPAVDERMAAALFESGKDRQEHRFVVDAIAAALAPVCQRLDVPEVPSIMQLRNVLHLGTHIRGELREPAPSALELVAALHPTPAIGGTPTRAALAWLAENEGLARGRYAGPVGWVDADGNGEFALGIRSADIDGSRARLVAGVGLVKGSDPESELAETQLKLQALLAAVVRP
jgi:menaquinone-specific isochorismate synthase